jgi:hypothetical protein
VFQLAMLPPPQRRFRDELGTTPRDFEDGDLPRLDGATRERLRAAATAVELIKLPSLVAKEGLSLEIQA